MSQITRCDECGAEAAKWPEHWLWVEPNFEGVSPFSPWHNKCYPTVSGDFCSFACLAVAAEQACAKLAEMRKNGPDNERNQGA